MHRIALAVAICLFAAVPTLAQDAPRLDSFRSDGRIASGKVVKYDLKEEATDFSYRIRAEYVEAKVQKLKDGRWVSLGKVRAKPPRPLDFWPVFKKMGTGKHRIVARACNGTGAERVCSKSRTVRFTVVKHIPHSD